MAVRLSGLVILIAACSRGEHPKPEPQKARVANPTVAMDSERPEVPEPPPKANVREPPPRGSAEPSRDAASRLAECKALGPGVPLPFSGPVTFDQKGVMVINDGGAPRVAGTTTKGIAPDYARLPPCKAGTKDFYCADASGAITRFAPGTTRLDVLAHASSGALFSVASVGDADILAYLAARKTPEGERLEAWAVRSDAKVPVRVSEDGSGATSVEVTQTRSGPVFVVLDARTGLTAVHARPTTPSLELGKDVVMFVGGPPEQWARLTLANGARGLFALLPLSRDSTSFGLLALPVHVPPQEVTPTWSPYENGIDPAPIAATHGGHVSKVVRAAPEAGNAALPQRVELGVLDATGVFRVLHQERAKGRVRHVAIADVDPLKVYFADDTGGHLFSFACSK